MENPRKFFCRCVGMATGICVLWFAMVASAGAQVIPASGLDVLAMLFLPLWSIILLSAVAVWFYGRRHIRAAPAAAGLALALLCGVSCRFASSWVFWKFYTVYTDAKLRPRAQEIADRAGDGWQNCGNIALRDCRDREDEVRRLFSGIRLSRDFRGMWIYDNCGTHGGPKSWIVAFWGPDIIYGSVSGCYDAPNAPVGEGKVGIERRKLNGENWVYYGSSYTGLR